MFSRLSIQVGWFLALRQLRRTSVWTTALIVAVMFLTFLNLVVVSGILVGLIQGVTNLYIEQETGDLYISTPDNKQYIDRSQEILSFLSTLPEIAHFSPRYSSGGFIEANYASRTDQNDKPNETAASIVGIDPAAEEAFSHMSQFVGEGSMLSPGDFDQILIGSQLVDRYSFGGDILPNISLLHGIYPGTKVRVTINGQTREMTVKGIIITTANSPLAAKVIMPGDELRQMLGRSDYGLNAIAASLSSGADPNATRDLILKSGVGEVAKVQTAEEAIPNGVNEIKGTFSALGNAFGSMGLAVAAITIFIVIFVNALTRRKYIGILKGIGITKQAIEVSYIFQSLAYALAGSCVGLGLLYGVLVPYTLTHPIVLPISKVILVAPLPGTMVRILLLVLVTALAGYLPARMIVSKNTLDSILGRN